MLLLLEDNSERLERFAATMRAIDPMLPIRAWRDAHAMVREAGPLLQSAQLISLDHDLEPEPGAPDPGDGLAVAKFLVSQSVRRPVIVHSSNTERARWMAGEFDLAGWTHWRVAPLAKTGSSRIGERWCSKYSREKGTGAYSRTCVESTIYVATSVEADKWTCPLYQSAIWEKPAKSLKAELPTGRREE